MQFLGGVSVSGDVVPGGKALCRRLGFSDTVTEVYPTSTEFGGSSNAITPYDAYERLRACGIPELRREEVESVNRNKEEVLI